MSVLSSRSIAVDDMGVISAIVNMVVNEYVKLQV